MSIGIVGTGISGLHLALRLQAAGVETTLYTPRGAPEVRESRLPNTVARFGSTRERERELGVDHWADWQWSHVHFSVAGTPLGFTGRFVNSPSSVDFRIGGSVSFMRPATAPRERLHMRGEGRMFDAVHAHVKGGGNLVLTHGALCALAEKLIPPARIQRTG